MKEFPIKFSFAGLDYSAKVVSFGGNLQFHVSEFVPGLSGIELPYVVYKKRKGVGYAWTVDANNPDELGKAIYAAIKKHLKL